MTGGHRRYARSWPISNCFIQPERSGVRAGAGEEDVDQPSGALLPAGKCIDVRNTDQRANQIEGIDIFAEVTAIDSALHQKIGGFLYLAQRPLVEPGSASDDGVESWGDDLL